MDILQTEARNLYDARLALQNAEDSRDAVNLQIQELIREHAPGLLSQQTAAEEQVKTLKAAEKVAYTHFVDNLTNVVIGMSQPYGKGKVVPMATVEEATLIEIDDPRNIGIVATWLVARGMSSCIKIDFKPVAFFWGAREDGTLPRTPDGLKEALQVTKGPNVKVASLGNWPELDSWYTPEPPATEE